MDRNDDSAMAQHRSQDETMNQHIAKLGHKTPKANLMGYGNTETLIQATHK